MYKKINSSIIAGCVLAFLFFSSCKKSVSISNNGAITIESFTPTQGGGTTEMLITGSNFSADTSQLSVTINGTPLKIVGANSHQIMAVIPPKTGSGPVVVSVHGQTATSSTPFTYIFNHIVTTLAGSGTAGYANGNGTNAQFNFAGNRSMGIVVDSNLNVYVADIGNYCIRKIDSTGNVTLFSGTPGKWGYAPGVPGVSEYALPYGLAIDGSGNVYVTDPLWWDIKKVTPDGNSTIIGWDPAYGIVYDRTSNALYYTIQTANGSVRRRNTDGSRDTTVVSGGLSWPAGITCDKSGNLFVSVNGENVIREISAGTWNSSVIAGTSGVAGYVDGAADSAQFSLPWGIAIDNNNNLYVAGDGRAWGTATNPDQAIRYITAGTWRVSTFAGSGTSGFTNGIGGAATFSAPTGVAVDKNGTVYVIDANNNCIRKIVSQ